jgi:hypothetical protein
MEAADITTGEFRASMVDLLGVLAYGELMGFERLAQDAALAPTIADEAALAHIADTHLGNFDRLRARLTELGAEPEVAMEPFRAALTEFHALTAPSDWLEGLVKAYVGDGISRDFYREVASLCDPVTRDLVTSVCDAQSDDYLVRRLRAAMDADPVVSGRLALWGRRLVGEALRQAQVVAAERDALIDLFVGTSDLASLGAMFSRLTDEHTRRMQALGLNA